MLNSHYFPGVPGQEEVSVCASFNWRLLMGANHCRSAERQLARSFVLPLSTNGVSVFSPAFSTGLNRACSSSAQ